MAKYIRMVECRSFGEISHHYSDATNHKGGAQSTPVVIPGFRFIHVPGVGFACVYAEEKQDIQASKRDERDQLDDETSQENLDGTNVMKFSKPHDRQDHSRVNQYDS
jgi:hypothetical protein